MEKKGKGRKEHWLLNRRWTGGRSSPKCRAGAESLAPGEAIVLTARTAPSWGWAAPLPRVILCDKDSTPQEAQTSGVITSLPVLSAQAQEKRESLVQVRLRRIWFQHPWRTDLQASCPFSSSDTVVRAIPLVLAPPTLLKLRWIELCPLKRYTEILTPSACACDLFRKRVFAVVLKLKWSHTGPESSSCVL